MIGSCSKYLFMTPHKFQTCVSFLPFEVETVDVDFDVEERENVNEREAKRRKLNDKNVISDAENVSDNSNEFSSIGNWIIAAFDFGKKQNYYLGQIINNMDGDEVEFQFYRLQIPLLRVFEQLPQKEIHSNKIIVAHVPKSSIDIMCGTKIKVMGPDLEFKCV